MQAMRDHHSCWASNVAGILKKEKLHFSSIIDDLEALTDVRPLSAQEIELKGQ
jgi:hypothetical protein